GAVVGPVRAPKPDDLGRHGTTTFQRLRSRGQRHGEGGPGEACLDRRWTVTSGETVPDHRSEAHPRDHHGKKGRGADDRESVHEHALHGTPFDIMETSCPEPKDTRTHLAVGGEALVANSFG